MLGASEDSMLAALAAAPVVPSVGWLGEVSAVGGWTGFPRVRILNRESVSHSASRAESPRRRGITMSSSIRILVAAAQQLLVHPCGGRRASTKIGVALIEGDEGDAEVVGALCQAIGEVRLEAGGGEAPLV